GTLLDDAAAVHPAVAADDDTNPALQLGAALGAAHEAGRDKLVIADAGSGIAGFAAWAEQLVAESTGKLGKGLLPVDVGTLTTGTPGWQAPGPDITRAAIVGAEVAADGPAVAADIRTSGTLGAQFLLWETAIAVAGRVIGIN